MARMRKSTAASANKAMHQAKCKLLRKALFKPSWFFS
jgi:hypothetical protein